MGYYSIIATIIGVITITLAFLAYFKTPSNLRNRLPHTIKQEGIEYAPEYTLLEKLKNIAIPFGCVFALFLILNYLLLPKLKNHPEFLCDSYGALYVYQWIGFLFALLVLFFIFIMLHHGKQMTQVFIQKQYPLPGHKVYKPTKVIKGRKAKHFALFKLSLVVISTLAVIVMTGFLFQKLNQLFSASSLSNICG